MSSMAEDILGYRGPRANGGPFCLPCLPCPCKVIDKAVILPYARRARPRHRHRRFWATPHRRRLGDRAETYSFSLYGRPGTGRTGLGALQHRVEALEVLGSFSTSTPSAKFVPGCARPSPRPPHSEKPPPWRRGEAGETVVGIHHLGKSALSFSRRLAIFSAGGQTGGWGRKGGQGFTTRRYRLGD